MSKKAPAADEDLATKLLGQLPKLEVDDTGVGGKRAEFQFERNIISTVGMTYAREMELMKELVGERWSETQTAPETES